MKSHDGYIYLSTLCKEQTKFTFLLYVKNKLIKMVEVHDHVAGLLQNLPLIMTHLKRFSIYPAS